MESKSDDELIVRFGEKPKILLTGNGFNYLSQNHLSWHELINTVKSENLNISIQDEPAIKALPYPLQPVVLTSDNVDSALKSLSKELISFNPSEEEKQIINKFLSLDFSAVLTTNYTYEIEKTLISDFCCSISKPCKYRHRVQKETKNFVTNQLETFFRLDSGSKSIWHIHGECGKPKTMILGFYMYGKLLSKEQQYISNFLKQYNSSFQKNKIFYIKNWIDYFMISDIYIVGQGLDISESDLWWLINCKKIHCKDTNIYLFNPDLTVEQKILAQTYGIKISEIEIKNNNYIQYYSSVCDEIQNMMAVQS